jgi:hypothetical protein
MEWIRTHGLTRCPPGVAQGVFDPKSLKNPFTLIGIDDPKLTSQFQEARVRGTKARWRGKRVK